MGGRSRKAKPAAKRRAPVAKPKNGAAKPALLDQDLLALGDPPSDPLAIMEYAAKVNAIMLRKVMKDPDLSTEKKSKEVRSISNTLKGLVPKARIYRAEQIVLNNKAKLEQKMSERRGAQLETLPPEPEELHTAAAPAEVHAIEEPQH